MGFKIADSDRAKVEFTWRRDIPRVDETESLRALLAKAEREMDSDDWQVAADSLEEAGYTLHAEEIRAWLSDVLVLSLDEVESVLGALAVDRRRFWDEAGGDRVPMTRSAIERIAATL